MFWESSLFKIKGTMVQLSEQQIFYIQQNLKNEGLSYEPLKDELLDHLCCMTETNMQLGNSFHDAIQHSFSDFCRKSKKSRHPQNILRP